VRDGAEWPIGVAIAVLCTLYLAWPFARFACRAWRWRRRISEARRRSRADESDIPRDLYLAIFWRGVMCERAAQRERNERAARKWVIDRAETPGRH
jgi:hypothetical protein